MCAIFRIIQLNQSIERWFLMKDKKNNQLKNARVGYQIANEQSMSYASIIWSNFNAMVVANSIIITGTTLLFDTIGYELLKTFFPLIGLFLCLIWLLQTKRSSDFVNYYILSAREIEEKYLIGEVNTISRGGTFSNGGEVKIELKSEQLERRLKASTIIRGSWASYLIIGTIFSIYFILLMTLMQKPEH